MENNEDSLSFLRNQTTIVAFPKLYLETYTDYPEDLLNELENPIPKIQHWQRLKKLIDKGLAGLPLKSPTISDEPKLFGFSSIPQTNPKEGNKDKHRNVGEYGHGLGFSKKDAIISSIGECLERTCLRLFPKDGLIIGKAKDLKKKYNVINIKEFINHKDQKDAILANPKTINSKSLKWLFGFDIILGRDVLIPAQLVYVPSTLEPFKDEPIIRFPISTGAAFGVGKDYSDCMLRGILECIERDGNMLSYLSQRELPRIIIDNKEIKKIISYFEKYRLTIDLFYSTTDIGVPSVIAVIRDKTNKLPFLTVGSSANLNPKKAVMGAIREAQQVRLLLRFSYFLDENNNKINSKKIETIQERCIYWSTKTKEKNLNFLLKTKKKIKLSKIPNLDEGSNKRNLKKILLNLKEKNYSVYVVDVSLPDIKENDCRVVKVLIPELHPLWLNEEFPCNFSKRLEAKGGYKAKEPHPFP